MRGWQDVFAFLAVLLHCFVFEIFNIVCESVSRNYFVKLFTKSSKYTKFMLGTIVVMAMVAHFFITPMCYDFIIKSEVAHQQYVVIEHYKFLIGKEEYIIKNESREWCMYECGVENVCTGGMYWTASQEESFCVLFKGTPDQFDVVPFHDDHSMLFLKDNQVTPGRKAPEDNFHYFVSDSPMNSDDIQRFCFNTENDYHPALVMADNAALTVATRLQKKLKTQHKLAFYYLEGSLEEVIYSESIYNMERYQFLGGFDGEGKYAETKIAYLVYQEDNSLKFVPKRDKNLFYALCQKDPFNLKGHSAFLRSFSL